MKRVVLDTNVLVSGLLILQGPPARILQQFRDRRWILLLSGAILEEYGRVLRRKKFGLPFSRIQEMLDLIERRSLRVIPSVHFNAIPQDPSDNEFLDVAVEGKADVIVSGDQYLLSLTTFQGIMILSPSQFLNLRDF